MKNDNVYWTKENNQGNMSTTDIYATNKRTVPFVKETTILIKSCNDYHILMVGFLNSLLSTVEMSLRLKQIIIGANWCYESN